jgi:hypothetical protein
MEKSVLARKGLARHLLGSGRTPIWDKAEADYRAAHTTCEMCGSTAGANGALDGAPGDQLELDAHDVFPYHLMTPTQQSDYNFLMSNFIVLHHLEHHRIAHCSDPNCLKYNPGIRQLAATVLAARSQCTSK